MEPELINRQGPKPLGPFSIWGQSPATCKGALADAPRRKPTGALVDASRRKPTGALADAPRRKPTGALVDAPRRKPTGIVLTLLLCALLMARCQSPQSTETPEPPAPTETNKPIIQAPPFSADSSYQWIQKQVEMGPRAPGTPAHSRCAAYLESELKRFTPYVRRQQPPVTTHDGKRFTLQNIIASFNPDAQNRILLCAHWDSRPRAEMDPNRPGDAILAANDGASGVAVLLEVARNLSQNPPPCGVDIVLFDLEDYGESSAENSYCLGSQYWSRSPHVPGYRAAYGILLDMVGGKGARFFREGTSNAYAPHVVDRVWGHALRLGYGSWFVNQEGNAITDDHYYINKISGIPTIDIIEMDPGSETGFGRYWHTHRDDLSVIDKTTLHAVGHTVLHTIFQE